MRCFVYFFFRCETVDTQIMYVIFKSVYKFSSNM